MAASSRKRCRSPSQETVRLSHNTDRHRQWQYSSKDGWTNFSEADNKTINEACEFAPDCNTCSPGLGASHKVQISAQPTRWIDFLDFKQTTYSNRHQGGYERFIRYIVV